MLYQETAENKFLKLSIKYFLLRIKYNIKLSLILSKINIKMYEQTKCMHIKKESY